MPGRTAALLYARALFPRFGARPQGADLADYRRFAHHMMVLMMISMDAGRFDSASVHGMISFRLSSRWLRLLWEILKDLQDYGLPEDCCRRYLRARFLAPAISMNKLDASALALLMAARDIDVMPQA